MTDHLTRATAIPRHERAEVFIALAHDAYGKDWRRVLAEKLGAPVSKIYQMTAKGTINVWTLAYLMAVIEQGQTATGDSVPNINAERLAELIAANPEVFNSKR